MIRTACSKRLLAALSVCLLLVGQAAAALHALEHDAGPLPGKGCSSCVTASQLGAASVDCPSAEEPEPGHTVFETSTSTGFVSAESLAPRSRGPPQSP